MRLVESTEVKRVAFWTCVLATLALGMSWGLLAMAAPVASDASATRQARESLRREFVQNFRQELANRLAVGPEMFDVQLENFKVEPQLLRWSPGARLELVGIGSAAFRRLDGLFSVAVGLQIPGQERKELQLMGVLKVTGPVYVAKQNLVRGQLVDAQSVQLMTLPWNTLPTGAMGVSLSELSGRQVRQHIGQGEVVFADLLEAPFLVQNNQQVALIVRSSAGITVHTRATSKQAGKRGELINVQQLETKKIVQAVVVDAGSVEISL